MRTLHFHEIIETILKNSSINLNKLSQITGINRGTLSSIFNTHSRKLPSVIQLDKITKALGYEEGHFYDSYIEEYFAEFTPHWRKLKPLLQRCVELEFVVKIERILDLLMEQNNQIVSVFELAETWLFDHPPATLIPFYECVIKNEKYRHNERVAISRYRIFQLQLKKLDFDNHLHAAIQFEKYQDELPVDYRLDALLKLINTYLVNHKWDKTLQYSREMQTLATTVYEQRLHLKFHKNNTPVLNTERHLVVYYAQGYLMQGVVYEEIKNYEQALIYPPLYKDLSWFEGLNEIGRFEVNKFKKFAYANDLSLRLLLGQLDKIEEYVEFLKSNPGEILNGIMAIFKAAELHNISVEPIWIEFEPIVKKFEADEEIEGNYYKRIIVVDQLEMLYRQMAIYYFQRGNYSTGVHYLSKCLALANQINKKSEFNEYPELMNILKEWSLLMERNHKNDPS